MKKILLIILILFPFLLHAQAITSYNDTVAAFHRMQDSIIKLDATDTAFLKYLPPPSKTLVTDQVNILSADQKQRLENRLDSLDAATTIQLAVVIIKTTGNTNILLYGRRLGNYWKIGRNGINNGILVLIAIGDRKMAILTGTGIQAVLTDSICSNIIQKDITPEFKKTNYFGGLNKGINNMLVYINSK